MGLGLFRLDAALVDREGAVEYCAKLSTRLLASSTSVGLTANCRRSLVGAFADTTGFEGTAGTTKVPLGCSPAKRATSLVLRLVFLSDDFLYPLFQRWKIALDNVPDNG